MQCFLVHWSRHNISSKHCKEHTPFPHSSRGLKTQGQDVVYLVPSRLSSQLAIWLPSLCVHIWSVFCVHPQRKRMLSVFLFFYVTNPTMSSHLRLLKKGPISNAIPLGG